MKRLLAGLSLFLFVVGFSQTASAINWVVTPDALAFGGTVVTGVDEINFEMTNTQPAGIFGAGFTVYGNDFSMAFDSDLYSWDSYNATEGYMDSFIVTVSTDGFYWNLPHTDPITADASTFVWGGQSYTDGTLDSYQTAPGTVDTISLATATPTTYYVSLVLDTKTLPGSDNVYPSWGSFHVNPSCTVVPEPSTLLLLGGGLLGIALYGRKRMKA